MRPIPVHVSANLHAGRIPVRSLNSTRPPARTVDLSRIDARIVIGTAIALLVALAAALGRVGADAGWLAALGHDIIARGAVPGGVPFAATANAHWPNALVLAELIMGGAWDLLGDRGLMLLQLLAVLGAMTVLARDARAAGARGAGTAAALLVCGLGALPSLAIARVQLFSLMLLPVLLALLRAQARAPSRRIWLAVPLLAVWSNLHGAALLGAGLLIVYLVLERARREPVLAAGVGLAGLAALCLTPPLTRTVTYYHGVLTNLAAQRGAGMWGPLSLSAPLDVVLVLAAALLIWRMVRGGARPWEWCATVLLAVAAVQADRNGVWLLFVVAVPAARGFAPERSLRAVTPVLGALAAGLLAIALARGPLPNGASGSLVAGAVALSHGAPVLADGAIDEQVALAGGRIWAGNPIDAFPRGVQAAYLDWLAGDRTGTAALARAVHVVLVSRGSPAQALMARSARFAVARSDATAVLYERRG